MTALLILLCLAAGVAAGWFGHRARGVPASGGGGEADTDDSGREAQSTLKTADTLRKCCKTKTPVMLLSSSSGKSARGRFAAASGNEVELELVSGGTTGFEPPSLICIQFNVAGRAHVSMCKLRRLRTTGVALPRLVVARPSEFTETEARIAFRIPIAEDSPLKVSLEPFDGIPIEGVGRDISRAGIKVIYEKGDEAVQGLEVGEEIVVKLVLGADHVSVRGNVRRVTSNAIGIFFPDSLLNGEVRAPADLSEVVGTLERQWLSAHSRAGAEAPKRPDVKARRKGKRRRKAA